MINYILSASVTGPDKSASAKLVSDLRCELDGVKSDLTQRDELVGGLRGELVRACHGVEGLGVVVQSLYSQLHDAQTLLGIKYHMSLIITRDICTVSHLNIKQN